MMMMPALASADLAAAAARLLAAAAAAAASPSFGGAAADAHQEAGRVVARRKVAVAAVRVPLADSAVDDGGGGEERGLVPHASEGRRDHARVDRVPDPVRGDHNLAARRRHGHRPHVRRGKNEPADVGIAHAARLRDAARPQAEGPRRVARAVLRVREVPPHPSHALPLRLGGVEPVVLGEAAGAAGAGHEPRLGVAEIAHAELEPRQVERDDGDRRARSRHPNNLLVHPLARCHARAEQRGRRRVARRRGEVAVEQVVPAVP
mmetsp:Transcript_9547/g.28570  ORF Transcript_9547/g.28570 Transcript_9547/m.28570 type:complete len:263 (+) Transcript_9547:500-1288(+)